MFLKDFLTLFLAKKYHSVFPPNRIIVKQTFRLIDARIQTFFLEGGWVSNFVCHEAYFWFMQLHYVKLNWLLNFPKAGSCWNLQPGPLDPRIMSMWSVSAGMYTQCKYKRTDVHPNEITSPSCKCWEAYHRGDWVAPGAVCSSVCRQNTTKEYFFVQVHLYH